MCSETEPDDLIEIRVPCKAEYVHTVRRIVVEFAESFNLPRSSVEALEIATSEAVSNIIRHAYNGNKTGPVRVRCFRKKQGIMLEIIDKGCGFSAPSRGVVPEVDMDREGGLGIILIKMLMDRVDYLSKPNVGTKIKMMMQV